MLESPPRIRVEWLVAIARVVLAGGAWVAVLIDPADGGHGWAVAYLLSCYLVFSIGILALVWAPTRFAPGWGVALHLYDLAAFAVVMIVTRGAANPFYAVLTFLLVCAAIRWHLRGAVWTAGFALVAYALAVAPLETSPRAAIASFGTRLVYVAVITALVAQLTWYQRRFHGEISRLAAWPRTVSRDPHAVISEVISRATELLEAPRLVLVWEDPDDARTNVALQERGEVAWTAEPEGVYGGVVITGIEGRSFQTSDAASHRGHVVVLTPRGFLRRQCKPLDERLRARFDMHAVQSWPIDGELVRGRIFAFEKPGMSLDDLATGESVARLVASRLDSVYMLRRLRDAMALEERVRVARDLHDSLLQSQAGAALHLLAARRLLDRDPALARARLDDVQRHLERGELEMRSFISNLRPRERTASEGLRGALSQRFAELRDRIERQWELKVLFQLDAQVDGIAERLADHLFRLVQEAVVNAARHADASVIRVDVSVGDGSVRLMIADDGKGFPFAGTYDLASLGATRGPLTLKERVAELRGDLTLTTSFDAGTEVRITVPLSPAWEG
jgi:signal transduction histidine kinase